MRAIKTMGEKVKAMRQGEVTKYTELPEDSRRHAIDPMIENARLLGATAVVAMRFDSSDIGQQLTEVVAYGTTVAARPALASRAREAPAAAPGRPEALLGDAGLERRRDLGGMSRRAGLVLASSYTGRTAAAVSGSAPLAGRLCRASGAAL